jgi:hypothetical protein
MHSLAVSDISFNMEYEVVRICGVRKGTVSVPLRPEGEASAAKVGISLLRDSSEFEECTLISKNPILCPWI